MAEKIFGIDLGTTNSAIAVFENDEARILKNIDGDEITPSVVFFIKFPRNGRINFCWNSSIVLIVLSCTKTSETDIPGNI